MSFSIRCNNVLANTFFENMERILKEEAQLAEEELNENDENVENGDERMEKSNETDEVNDNNPDETNGMELMLYQRS